MGSGRGAAACVLAALVVGTVVMSVHGGESTHAAATAVTPARAPGMRAGRALRQLAALHNHGTLAGPVPRSAAGTTQVTSATWAGWVDVQPVSGSYDYRAVSASWTQPSVACNSEDRVVATWVGLDGYSSDTVEQAGTLAQCFEDTAYYYTWWEMYPTDAMQILGSTVHAGDSITASVSFAGGSYSLRVTDTTTSGNDLSVSEVCGSGQTCSNSSAEWIAERTTNDYGVYPLADHSEWNPLSASVSAGTRTGTIDTFPNAETTMYDVTGTYALETPTGFNTTNHGFGDKWRNSY